ncbi:myocilin [Pelobates fuscus]|uniref:myocilin n=1 Tax=Pelobates fuscus TaxID=191477 RepID=UPI002FE4CEF8
MGSIGLHIMLSLLIWMAQGSPQLRRANDRHGQCTYTFTVPSPREGSCSEPGEVNTAIQDLRRENSDLRQHTDSLQTRVTLLERVVNKMLGGEVSGHSTFAPQASENVHQELERLRREKDEWEGQRGSLEMAYSDLLKEKSSLEEEKQNLNERLEKVQGQCPKVAEVPRTRDQQVSPRQVSRWGADGVGYQELKSELTALPASRMIPESHSVLESSENKGIGGSCGELTWVGVPSTFRKADSIAGKYGVWMKDPEPASPFTRDTIWRINTVGADIRQVMEYENTDQLAKGYPAKVYVLPRSMESNGAVVYRGSLYYQRRKSRILVKYDFKTESVAVQKELPNAGYHGKFPYSWGGYTDIDLAVDEMGLWVIYSTENMKGSVVISQLDPTTLDVKQSWETSIRKQSVANAFMICGTLYTVGSYSSSSTTVNFAFDTQTGVQRQISVPFQNQYGYASMIDYNPNEKKIYGWDNFNMVAYDVRLSKM